MGNIYGGSVEGFCVRELPELYIVRELSLIAVGWRQFTNVPIISG